MTARKNAERELARREIHRRKSSGLWDFKLRDLAEPALVMGSSMIAEPISGLAGITALPFGADVAAGVVEGVQDALTFEPRLQKTKDDLAALSHAVEPIGDAMQKLSTVPGDAVFEATGSPLLATIAHSAIPATASILGLKGSSKLGGAKFEVGDIGGQGSKIGGKQRGVVSVSAKNISDVKDSLKNKGIKNAISERADSITVDKIIVPEGSRGSGVGTAAMGEIIDYADSVGKRIELTPSGDFGGSVPKLKKFYKKLGFIDNKGKNKDFEISETMYRPPS